MIFRPLNESVIRASDFSTLPAPLAKSANCASAFATASENEEKSAKNFALIATLKVQLLVVGELFEPDHKFVIDIRRHGQELRQRPVHQTADGEIVSGLIPPSAGTFFRAV